MLSSHLVRVLAYTATINVTLILTDKSVTMTKRHHVSSLEGTQYIYIYLVDTGNNCES